ncbi:hypothetical protein L1049_022531 [Liquidambar formosana]|uniref:DNA helicase Pif1-like 2B domain-containing protein n=1 Tax=Liquidambar formosana TaxID=63359 RepID=A0AAP0RCK2_LIQFO
MYVSSGSLTDETRKEVEDFSKWILDVGDGILPGLLLSANGESDWIRILDDLLIKDQGRGIQALIDNIYPNLKERYLDSSYLQERAIFVPKNVDVDKINSKMLSLIPGPTRCCLSADESCCGDRNLSNQDNMYPVEYLNSLKPNGIPDHCLELKVGVPVVLLRNLDPSIRLCNGTRLIIQKIHTHIVEAKIITGTNIGRLVFIPRTIMSPSDTNLPFVLRRRQFPLRISFAMMINKSQGQSLHRVGVFLPNPVFTHGQLYVAISRTTSRASLKILILSQGKPVGYTRNVVYKDALGRVQNA